MKLYVLPVEKACDARCAFCITDFRETAPKELLSLEDLASALTVVRPEKIEITGGGEPTLHSKIDSVISLCATNAPTIMYTHGAHLSRVQNVHVLSELCVSVAHYDKGENERIMGVSADFDAIKNVAVPVKFSLLVHASGISEVSGVRTYIDWASQYANKVVVRQLFEHNYFGTLPEEFVSTEQLFKELGIVNPTFTPQGNPVFDYAGLCVEIEYRSCACEMDNPVLHADGNLHRGWSGEYYDINRK